MDHFHKDWLIEIRTLLRTQLPPQYALLIEEHEIAPDDEETSELFTQYSLLIRRSPENAVVAAVELLSPSNKGTGNRFDEDRHLRKRSELLQAGVNLLEIDALRQGHRALPPALGKIPPYDRLAWTVFHHDARRTLRAWGWNDADPLPKIPWNVDLGVEVLVDLAESLTRACEFNRWGKFVASAERGMRR